MELRLLTTFLKVAQLQSFSKAAESLGYSQFRRYGTGPAA